MNSVVEEIRLTSVSPQEKINLISGIWKNVLATDEVGPQEEFFDLGGNSMLLLAMLEVVQEKFGQEIALEDLSEGVSIEKIASLLH